MIAQWAKQENHASAGRQIVFERIEALTREIGNVSMDVRMATQDIAELKNDIETRITPTVENYKIGVARKEGAMWAGKLMYGLLAAAATAAGFAIHLVYSGRWH